MHRARDLAPARRILLAALVLVAVPVRGEEMPRPFEAGETLTYQVSLGRWGAGGKGSLKVEDSEPVRGEPVVRLSFDFATRIGPFSVRHRSRSWLSTKHMTSLRYEVDEKAPFNDLREQVEIFPAEKRWKGLDGEGESPTVQPLDELSYLYLLRTLVLGDGDRMELNRHFDPRRNPATMRVLRREKVQVPAGEFAAVVVEMKVRDPHRLGGQGVMRLHVSDDARRLLLRIESEVPVVGRLVLELLPDPKTLAGNPQP